MPAPKLQPLLSVDEVAQTLHVSTKTIRRMIENGVLHHHRIGRAIRISSEDITNYINGARR